MASLSSAKLPDAVMDNLQQSREMEQRFHQQQQRMDAMQKAARSRVTRQRRLTLAGLACMGAAISVFPGAAQQLAAAPTISWVLALAALWLLWPRMP